MGLFPNSSPVSLSAYAAGLAASGVRVFNSSLAELWISHESWAMVRVPIFLTRVPSPHVLREVLSHRGAFVASYILEPDESHRANCWLYKCTDRSYSLDKLPPPVRRN